MPNMANITVKNVAGTDVIYVAATPSAGDKTAARWTQNAASSIQGFRPSFDLLTQNNGNGDVRRAEVTFLYPVTYTDPGTGLTKLNQSVKITLAAFLPRGLSTDDWLQAFTQAGNLLISPLVRSAIQDGYAPT